MSYLYEKVFREIVASDGDIAVLPFPGRCDINKITVEREGNGPIAVDVFNRAFTSDAINIDRIVENADNNTRIYLTRGAELPSHVGDIVAVAGSSVVGYNTDHRVLGVGVDTPGSTWADQTRATTQQYYLDTDQSHTADATGGTATRAIPAADQELYRVIPQITGTDVVLSLQPATGDTVQFVNQDPIGSRNIGKIRKIYLKFSAAATYRVAVAAEADPVN